MSQPRIIKQYEDLMNEQSGRAIKPCKGNTSARKDSFENVKIECGITAEEEREEEFEKGREEVIDEAKSRDTSSTCLSWQNPQIDLEEGSFSMAGDSVHSKQEINENGLDNYENDEEIEKRKIDDIEAPSSQEHEPFDCQSEPSQFNELEYAINQIKLVSESQENPTDKKAMLENIRKQVYEDLLPMYVGNLTLIKATSSEEAGRAFEKELNEKMDDLNNFVDLLINNLDYLQHSDIKPFLSNDPSQPKELQEGSKETNIAYVFDIESGINNNSKTEGASTKSQHLTEAITDNQFSKFQAKFQKIAAELEACEAELHEVALKLINLSKSNQALGLLTDLLSLELRLKQSKNSFQNGISKDSRLGSSSISSTLRYFDKKIEAMLMRIEEFQRLCQDKQSIKYPAEFYCPLTLDIMKEPVIAADGHSYEKVAIEEWLRINSTSPQTNKLLSDKRLIPNHNLRKMIEDFEAT